MAMNEIPSDLIRRLTQLSDLNSFFKFVVFHLHWIEIYTITLIAISFVAMAVIFLMRKKAILKKCDRAISYSMDAVLVLFTMQMMAIFIAGYKLDHTPLNNEQSNLIKSIENPKFQDLLELHIYEYGSNIKAVSKALKKFKNNGASE